METIEGSTPGLTREAYAIRKRFDESRLERWHVTTARNPYNGEPAVALPYFDLKGQLTRTKYRTPTGTVWDDQRHLPLILYGLWLLPRVTEDRPIILVEGESDCHAAWHHSVMALGLPGCSTWRSSWVGALGRHPVYVWKEPDHGGSTMAEKIAADLPDAKCIQPVGVKDLADLHLKSENFGAGLRRLMDAAKPIRDVVIPVPKARPDIRVWRETKRAFGPFDNPLLERARQVPLVDLLERLGFEIHGRSREKLIFCPFHDDGQNPSLKINEGKGVWHCWGCDAGGDSIEFVMRLKGLPFNEALKVVAA